MNVAVIGAGWAGLAAAIHATQAGHNVTVFEASAHVGGRARALKVDNTLDADQANNAGNTHCIPAGRLDNGQHILIGAYTETLRLMRLVGLQPLEMLGELPLTLCFADGAGLQFPNWPSPLDALAGILGARSWSWAARLSLLRYALRWQRHGFTCDASWTVQRLCAGMHASVWQDLIEPLCVAALNTPASRADASVFLRVLHDALLGAQGSSHLLLPRVDLNALFPDAAVCWLRQHGGQVCLSQRVKTLVPSHGQWLVDGTPFARVVLATDASNAALALTLYAQAATPSIASAMLGWATLARALRFESIATVYAQADGAGLSAPLLALRSSAQYPAQFVFDRGQLGGPHGLLAFVVSACQSDRASVQAQVLQQALDQLHLALQPVQTVVEKRATFACTPRLQRPPVEICAGLLACGDYVAGPYPATLEGALRSARAASALLSI